MVDTDVLIAGAGPIGLTAGIELRRRGVDCRIVDPLLEPPQYAKAVGVQPRALEVFEGMGVLPDVLNAAIQLRGQIMYVNGEEVKHVEMIPPLDVPFGFVAIPQYETERVLRERLASLGLHVERGTRLASFEQDGDGVTAVLTSEHGDETVRAKYLVGCDGAHSIVRKTLGLSFEGGAFEEQYMLGDVEVDWSVPKGWGIRATHETNGKVDDALICIPLPGRRRYRMSMLVPEDLATQPATDKLTHGFEGRRKPELSHIQAVIDRLSPEPATASNLRWSSVFRISHRIVDAYGRGRVFIAGDAAHIHPPTGAQGMNTGVQDAHNLAWKLALAVSGQASDELLASYDAERRPVGEEVVGRTVRSAREGIGADSADPDFIVRREAQLLIDYADSPIVGRTSSTDSGPQPGQRAPDAIGLTRDAVASPFRLFSLFRSLDHTLLIYADDNTEDTDVEAIEALASAAKQTAHGKLDVYLVAAPNASVDETLLPLVRDTAGEFARMYAALGSSAFVIRPDGYLGSRQGTHQPDDVVGHLKTIFR